MTARERTLRTVAVVALAVLVNLGLDVALDLPMVVRWGVALVAVLVLLRLLDRRRSSPRWAADEQRRVPPVDTAGPAHPHGHHPLGGGPADRGERLGG